MIDFSKISQNTFLGRFLRSILRCVPPNTILPILQGVLRGKKWIIGSGVFGYWLGTYEPELQNFMQKKIKNGSIFFDIGANVGFFTLIASILVGKEGKVFSFEPFPKNISYLKRHIELNRCANVAIVESAVFDKSGQAFFEENKSNAMGKLSSRGKLRVETISLDDWINEGKLPAPDFIKIDVEGAEVDVLRGMRCLLKQKSIMLSIYLTKEVHYFLKNLGYQAHDLNGTLVEEASIETRGGDAVYFKE